MSRQFRWTLLLVVAAAAAIRLWRLSHFSYGLDEMFQAYWCRYPWREFWNTLRSDAVHPPLDYLIDWIVQRAHPTEALSKIPSVLWGVATVPAFGVLVARRIEERAGLVAASLLALAPFHVHYSQELRPYSLGLLGLTLSVLALDAFLERPSVLRLGALFFSCLVTAYSLYVAATVLALIGLSLVLEDCLFAEPTRRRSARRLLFASPLFVGALWLAYLPWWPVLLEAMHRPPPVPAEPFTLHRLDRALAFFAFAGHEGDPLRWTGGVYWGLALIGILAALRRPGGRFLTAWLLAGFGVVELLGQLHPHWYATRRFLPAGLVVPALVALPLAGALRRPTTRLFGGMLLIGLWVLEARGLESYFRDGRADWRTLANFLRTRASSAERVFVENQYAQICLGYYLSGPDWLYRAQHSLPVSWDLQNLEGETVRLNWAWKPGTRAWLVLAGEPKHPPLRDWAEDFPSFSFPRAEGAVLHRLDPERRPAWIPAR